MSAIVRAYKTELRPAKAQAEILGRWCGASRWIYNWGLEQRISHYQETQETLSHYTQDKAFTALKRDPEFEWLNDIPRRIPYFALRDLDRAYKNFFRRVKQGGPPGFPRFKSRGRSRASFTLYGTDILVDEKRIRLPRIGWVCLKERGYLPVDAAKYGEVTVSERAGRWFVAIVAEVPHEQPSLTGETIAAHPGVKQHLTLSDGTRTENVRATEQHARKLRRLQRKLARQTKGGANREKTKRRIARLHYRIACLREDSTHKATHLATTSKRPSRLVLQAWDVKGMLQDEQEGMPRRVRASIRRSIADANMSEMLRQLRYKAEREGIDLMEVAHTYAVTLRCSRCGNVKDKMPSTQMIYRCVACGFEADREENAVRNLIAATELAMEEA